MTRLYTIIYHKHNEDSLYEFEAGSLEDVIIPFINDIDTQVDKDGIAIIHIKQAFENMLLTQFNYNIQKTENISQDSKFIIYIQSENERLILYRKTKNNIDLDYMYMDGCKILMTHKFKN